MNQERIAMITMPVQRWTARYTKEEALKRGTIFRELDLPFFAERPRERKELVRILEDRGDSLTKDGGGNWRKGPMPWEGVCG